MLANCELRIAIIWEMWWRETHRTDRTYMPLSFAITNLENLRWHKLNIHAALKKRKIRKLELIWWMVSLSLSCLPCIFFSFFKTWTKRWRQFWLIIAKLIQNRRIKQTSHKVSGFSCWVFFLRCNKKILEIIHTHTHTMPYIDKCWIAESSLVCRLICTVCWLFFFLLLSAIF